MGRKKLVIQSIDTERRRYQAFCRRRAGFLKKGQELSVLCDVSIVVMLQVKGSGVCAFYSSDHPADRSSPDWEDRLVSAALQARRADSLIDHRKFSDCIAREDSSKSPSPCCISLTNKIHGAFATPDVVPSPHPSKKAKGVKRCREKRPRNGDMATCGQPASEASADRRDQAHYKPILPAINSVKDVISLAKKSLAKPDTEEPETVLYVNNFETTISRESISDLDLIPRYVTPGSFEMIGFAKELVESADVAICI